MITATAFLSHQWNQKKKKNEPEMVIIVTEDGLNAVGLAGTNSEIYANDLVKRFGKLKGDELRSVLEDLTESFERMPHRHGYGGISEIINYVGSEKARIDKIVDQLVTKKVERSLGKD